MFCLFNCEHIIANIAIVYFVEVITIMLKHYAVSIDVEQCSMTINLENNVLYFNIL